MNPIDILFWYINLMFTHMYIILPVAALAVWYEFCKEIQYRRAVARWAIVMAYASRCGITYEEADKIVITDHLK